MVLKWQGEILHQCVCTCVCVVYIAALLTAFHHSSEVVISGYNFPFSTLPITNSLSINGTRKGINLSEKSTFLFFLKVHLIKFYRNSTFLCYMSIDTLSLTVQLTHKRHKPEDSHLVESDKDNTSSDSDPTHRFLFICPLQSHQPHSIILNRHHSDAWKQIRINGRSGQCPHSHCLT